ARPGPASAGTNAPPIPPAAAAGPGGEGAELPAEETSEVPADDDPQPQEWDQWDWEELQPLPRRLLQHMLGRETDTLDNLATLVWATDQIKETTVRVAIYRANEF